MNDWEVVPIDEYKKKLRISLQLDHKYLSKLKSICQVLGYKQYSKAIKFLIDSFMSVKGE